MFQDWLEVKSIKYHTCLCLTASISNFYISSLLTWFLYDRESPFHGCSDHPVITSSDQKQGVSEIGTVDSRYLEIQGTLWNTSRYPYFDISDLRNWGKQLIQQTPLTEWIFNLTPKLGTYWNYCGKEEKLLLRSNFSSFPQYFVACW